MKTKTTVIVALAVGSLGFGLLTPVPLQADEVLDWNGIMRTAVASSGLPGPLTLRPPAIVQSAVFDAVNGIDQRYTPIHVTDKAPAGASRRAAAVEAAYTTLVALFPSQTATFDQAHTNSLAIIAADSSETSASIASGQAWGKQVANAILTWRSTDGFDPSPSTYQGSQTPGKWRPTPPANANGLAPSLATTVPWVIPSPSAFRPPGPPDLTSTQYAADFNETKTLGATNSTVRTPDQTQAAVFWQGTAMTFWNRAAASASVQRQLSLLENARLFGLLNVAMSDALISCFDAKYFYSAWRPITAIRLASTDNNPDTVEQDDWTPLIVTPPFPEYTSAHGSVSGAARSVLVSYFGDNVSFDGWSEAFGPTTLRHYANYSAAADEANLARIWGGIHFRTAVVDGRAAGDAIGNYVMANAAQEKRINMILELNGTLGFWTMNGTDILEGITGDPVPAGWQIVGAGDFNHDNQTDLVLQKSDGSVAFWLMDGTTVTERHTLFAVPDGWQIVATGDFNSDQQTDLILQNTDGTVAFWFMDGMSVSGTELSYQLPAGWRIAGTGRFGNGPGTDIVLQHTDGSVAFWLMDGTTITKGTIPYTLPSGWKIVATGDYNEDGNTDVVLQHSDGSVAFWLMNGTTIKQGFVPYKFHDGWQIVGPR